MLDEAGNRSNDATGAARCPQISCVSPKLRSERRESKLAFAKVNLALAVYPRSADGYHPFAGIFQSVSLADEVSIEPASDDSITVEGGEAPPDESNLAWRALDAVQT